MTAAAFRGTYADFKLIKTRGVVSISFEVPVEQAQAALDVLGGMPVAASEIWCGIARLTNPVLEERKSQAEPKTRSEGVHAIPPAGRTAGSIPATGATTETQPVDGAKTKTAFRDMRLANQAGMLCAEVPFQRFLAERLKYEKPFSKDEAADHVHRHCNVASRKDIRPDSTSGKRWERLVMEYRTWLHAPEYA
jgi:hypothetical protein